MGVTMETALSLDDKLVAAKKAILDLCKRSGRGKAHLGGCMSCIDTLVVLYNDAMRRNEDGSYRDRFVMSKAHAAIAQYAAMWTAGILTDDEISLPLRGDDTILFRHPRRNPEKGLEVSCGSLGMGIGYAAGLAYSAARRQQDTLVYAMVGDGECNEGSVWETAAFAGHYHLDNLVVIIDQNGLQLDGPTEVVFDAGDMSDKWASFGFDVSEVDGHDLDSLRSVFALQSEGRPRAIIARTLKGHGLSFAEGRTEWHDNVLTDELYELACREIGVQA